MNIGIYYIATDCYKNLFEEFAYSVENLFPNEKKTLMVISDGLEEWKGKSLGNYNTTIKLCPRINHYPWPVVTLYKHYHILQNWNNDFTHVGYFNANAKINKNNPELWYDPDKLNVSYHSFNGKNHDYSPWYAININKASSAYLENETYEYIQGGFFFGRADIVKNMCEDCNNMLWQDTQRHMFAQWHDESYINKWCATHENLVNRKYIMSVYKDALNDETFVFLSNKGKLINDVKVNNIQH